ncbi:MAG: GNAT family acetyltransferase [Anderseniella sp.]
MASVEFRPVQDTEVAGVIALWDTCGLTRPWNDPDKDIAFARSGPASDLLIMVDERTVIASVMVGHDGHRGIVYYVATHPDFQRKGLGAAAMRAAESWLTQRGVWKLNLLVRAENEAVRSFYEKLGYEVEPRLCMARKLIPAPSE